jgi:hypothetical protein
MGGFLDWIIQQDLQAARKKAGKSELVQLRRREVAALEKLAQAAEQRSRDGLKAEKKR